MAKKFFNYSFQIERTKKTGIIFLVVITVLIGGFFVFYKSKSNTTKLDDLKYKVILGMNTFDDKNCGASYRLNYQKKTCGTICIRGEKENNKYVNELQEEMKKNGFVLDDLKSKTINNQKYSYLKTKGIPSISYYVTNYNKKTYIIEYIDQSSYLTSKNQNKCEESFSSFTNSLRLK